MGKTLFIKIIVVVFTALSIGLMGIYFLFKSTTTEMDSSVTVMPVKKMEKNVTIVALFDGVTYEKNNTLDAEYKSVASQIEVFIRKQKSFEQNIVEIVPQKIEAKKQNIVQKVVKKQKALPKLAIIMDDVGFYEQVQIIKTIPFPITPSIFPPNEYYPDTVKIAKEFKNYMVHFPMEAFDYKNTKEIAVKVTDSLAHLDKRVKKMRQNFPKAIAINNHTGSKFTCDLDAMDRFFSVLNKYEIEFIDSRTSAETKCLEAGKINNREIMQRDIFLDNVADVEYIKNRLEEAVKIAKKNGKAIAICHPRELTFEVLKNAKDILKDVELVYVNELM